jgi:hypothetical protein
MGPGKPGLMASTIEPNREKLGGYLAHPPEWLVSTTPGSRVSYSSSYASLLTCVLLQ